MPPIPQPTFPQSLKILQHTSDPSVAAEEEQRLKREAAEKARLESLEAAKDELEDEEGDTDPEEEDEGETEED